MIFPSSHKRSFLLLCVVPIVQMLVWCPTSISGFSTLRLLSLSNERSSLKIAKNIPQIQIQSQSHHSSTQLCMGFWDRLTGNNNEEGDFIKLNDAQDASEFGPGPLVVLYNIPDGVTNEEVEDMMADGAPLAFKRGIKLYRIRVDEEATSSQADNNAEDPILDLPMKEALEGIDNGSFSSADRYTPAPPGTLPSIGKPPIVVTLFSGFSNDEMLQAYQIVGSEVYQEAQLSPACAKAVPNAMEKPLRQVIEEIGGDHREAMMMSREEAQQKPQED